jgi:hypothetical protein
MEINEVMQLVNKCTDDKCVKIISQNYMVSQVFITLFIGIFMCLSIFIICKYFTKFLK